MYYIIHYIIMVLLQQYSTPFSKHEDQGRFFMLL